MVAKLMSKIFVHKPTEIVSNNVIYINKTSVMTTGLRVASYFFQFPSPSFNHKKALLHLRPGKDMFHALRSN